MKLPTLRQVSGFAMIVNTFLPAVVVVTLGLMTWSTVTTIKRNACATVSYVKQAMNDDKEKDIYLAAVKVSDDAGKRALQGLVGRRLNARPLPEHGSCAQWQDLRASIKGIFANELYGETVHQIELEKVKIAKRFETVRTAAKRAIPKITPITPPDFPGLREFVSAVNALFKIVGEALTALGNALASVGQGVTEPFDTAGENLKKEFQKVDYKRAVAWELLDRFWSDTADLFDKFWWFFVILTLWLVLSYALWVYRRLAVGWALLCNREAVQ
jgi:hypothetical protein